MSVQLVAVDAEVCLGRAWGVRGHVGACMGSAGGVQVHVPPVLAVSELENDLPPGPAHVGHLRALGSRTGGIWYLIVWLRTTGGAVLRVATGGPERPSNQPVPYGYVGLQRSMHLSRPEPASYSLGVQGIMVCQCPGAGAPFQSFPKQAAWDFWEKPSSLTNPQRHLCCFTDQTPGPPDSMDLLYQQS